MSRIIPIRQVRNSQSDWSREFLLLLAFSDLPSEISDGARKMDVHHSKSEPWKVTIVDTGEQTLTGGRLKRVEPYLGNEDFCFTYGDGLSDVNISKVMNFHKEHGKLATLVAIQPQGRYGALEIEADRVMKFQNPWVIRLGSMAVFFVLNPKVLSLIDGDQCTWEKAPLETLSSEGELKAYRHHGFWQAMDTLRDKNQLESLWQSGHAPWKVWK